MPYEFIAKGKRAEKQFYSLLRDPIVSETLKSLQENPRKSAGAHKLRGNLEGKWACKLGYDLRMIYEIDDDAKEIIVLAAGSHKIYK